MKFPTAAQQIAFQEYIDSIGEAERRVERLSEEIRKLLPQWKRAPLVAALQALRGVSLMTAVTLVAEIEKPRAWETSSLVRSRPIPRSS